MLFQPGDWSLCARLVAWGIKKEVAGSCRRAKACKQQLDTVKMKGRCAGMGAVG